MRSVDVLKLKLHFHYNARDMIKKIEVRQATPADLKADAKTLKKGQPYCIGNDTDENLNGIFVITGSEDPLILKEYLDAGLLYVPINDFRFQEFVNELNEKEEEHVQQE